MNKWDLNNLYNEFNSEYLKDFEDVEELIGALNKVTEFKEDEISTIEEYLNIQEKIKRKLKGLQGYPTLRVATNVNDNDASKFLSNIQNLITKIVEPEVLFKSWFKNVNYKNYESEIIKRNEYYLSRLKKEAQNLLSEKEEVLFAKMSLSGGNAWSKLQGELTSKLEVEMVLDKELVKIPLSEARNLAYSDDSQIRKTAYEAELKTYEKIEDSVAYCISNVKKEARLISEMRGFNSPLEKTLSDSRMSKETLDSMLESIKDYLPNFRKYLKKKAEYLGYENGLPFYDLFAPLGKNTKTYTYEECQDIVNNNFESFSIELADLSRKAFENNWIDVEPRKGKRGGAFCYNLQHIDESRILTNFTGSFSNVTTIAHELGHAYHGAQVSNNTPLNWDYTMPVAETASIFCETVVTKNILKDLEDDDKLTILEQTLKGQTQVIVDIMSRYLFESKVFDKIDNGHVTANELSELMIESQKETYGDVLDYNYLHPYMWINKSHYYRPNLQFYNFPYAFGLLYGKGLYSIYLEDKGSFVQQYDLMLRETGKNTVENVGSMMGIDVTNKEFWESSLKIISQDIDEFCKLVDKLK
ncbi:M3 family oligoendopeptidase [Mycoplasmatota bacterium]|nr:M3 family oligoendopeptidase [Mycoplasmatota bacterium]